jgi:CRISPR/Cas system endoribonuclease Cas6 (RAMP superfamily)
MSQRSPKVGINQLSSMEFRGLASDCVCNHRTPPTVATHQQHHVTNIAYTVLYSLEGVIKLYIVFVTHLKYLTSSNVLHSCTHEEQNRAGEE